MIKLNLEAKTDEEKYLRDYLENNASEILADKINNGVKIEKDGKTLINKKDLNSFMDFAYEEASKLRKNNERMLAVQKKQLQVGLSTTLKKIVLLASCLTKMERSISHQDQKLNTSQFLPHHLLNL